MRNLQGDHEGAALRIGVVVSRFNESVTGALLKGALEGLEEAQVPSEAVTVVSVPGAFELAGTAGRLASSGTVDAVVCLGADDFEQAEARAGGQAGNKGYEAALDAVEMANLYRSLAAGTVAG